MSVSKLRFWMSCAPAVIAMAAASHASAQVSATADTAIRVGEVVVTGSRNPPITNVLTSVDVVGGSVLQRESVDNTFQLFNRTPGVLTTNFGQGTTNGAISVRGFNGEGGVNAVKLLVDGVPSNVNDGFAWMMDAVFPLDIERIEVVRGTSDARYGLNNIAGNVNIFTRTGGTYVDARALAGSFNTYDGQAAAGYETGGISQNYFAGYRRTDGYRDHADAKRWTAAGKWFAELGPTQVGAIARYYEGQGQEPGFLLVQDAYSDRKQSYSTSQSDGGKRRIGQYSLHADTDLGGGVTNTTRAYYNRYDDLRFVRFAASIPQQERRTGQNQYGAITTFDWNPTVQGIHSLALEAGADIQWQSNRYQRFRTVNRTRTSQTLGQAFDLTVWGGYVQAVVEPTEWLKITPAYRIDKVEGHFTNRLNGATYPINDYGTIGQPKISAAITPIPDVTVYGNYGRTFQIGLGAASYLIPPQTTNLEPSHNDGFEGGVKYRFHGWLEARAALWRQTASGEVQFNELSATFDNLGKTRRTGFDVQLTANPTAQLSVWAAYSRQRGVIVTPDPATPEQRGNTIDHVPRNIFSGGVDYRPTDKLRLSLLANAQSDYELDTSNATGRFGDYWTLNVEAAYKVTKAVELSLQVKNLNNDRYEYVWWDGEESLHAPADPRAAYASVRVAF